ncbi:MAG: transcriptional regulator GcvA [Rhodospirillales bacterium]|nr:transcriptional regulator GcvA [Rhodospirillales bacterium]
MSKALPSLNGLRAFEAAARHLNFTRAAEELNVTQAAVSHQIKGLEERLGQPLFRRLNRKLLLTDAGQTLLAPMSQALAIMTEAVARIEGDDGAGVLTVSTTDSIATNWLVPRLGRFRASYPDIDVRMAISDDLADFSEGGVDVALRYGRGNYPGQHVVPMMTEGLFPVCSPMMLENGPPLVEPGDLRHYTLIHDNALEGWPEWFAAAGVTKGDFTHGQTFSHSNLVMRAALIGEGVALGRSQLVADDLASGRLVKPFEISVPSTWAYYIVSAPAHANRFKVKAFREWVLEQAKPLNRG